MEFSKTPIASMSAARKTLFITLLLPTLVSGMAPSFYLYNNFIHIYPPNTTYESPLHNPAIYKEESLATLTSLLAEKKYDVNKEGSLRELPLKEAIISNNRTSVELLLKYGANPNQISRFQIKDSPLSWCVEYGTPEITTLLIQRGANPNLATKDYHSLLYAVRYNTAFDLRKLSNIGILLRGGANPLIATQDNQTIFTRMSKKFDSIYGSKEQYLRVWKALIRYFVAWKILSNGFNLPPKIAEHILTFVDFGLDDYHIPIVKCAICYDEKKFRTIPCSKNSHTDSICSACISNLTDCPLCREKLSK